MVAAARALPGVRGAAPMLATPFSGTGGWNGQFTGEGQSREQASGNPMFNIEIVLFVSLFAAAPLPLHRRITLDNH